MTADLQLISSNLGVAFIRLFGIPVFAERVKEEGQPAVDGYLSMLKGGCSEAPLELLKGAGVDLTSPETIAAALERFDRTITELAALLEVEM